MAKKAKKPTKGSPYVIATRDGYIYLRRYRAGMLIKLQDPENEFSENWMAPHEPPLDEEEKQEIIAEHEAGEPTKPLGTRPSPFQEVI